MQHGGAGTTHALCAGGVPSVVVPHVGDQRYWADRLRRIGAAPAPLQVDRLDGEALADAVIATADDVKMRGVARRLAAAIEREDGTAQAVRRIEALEGTS